MIVLELHSRYCQQPENHIQTITSSDLIVCCRQPEIYVKNLISNRVCYANVVFHKRAILTSTMMLLTFIYMLKGSQLVTVWP